MDRNRVYQEFVKFCVFFDRVFLMTKDFSARQYPDTLVLFDVDGTLTPARKTVSKEMLSVLSALRDKVVIGFVGGSDLSKQKEQLGEDVLSIFDFCFSENGLTAYKNGVELASESFIGYLGEERYSKLANWILSYISKLSLPKKR
jgi:phosphomannomutase